MKKALGFIFICSILLFSSGCSKTEKMVCTKTEDIGSSSITEEEEVTFKDGYAVSETITINATFDSEENAKEFISGYENKEQFKVKQDGKNVSIVQEDVNIDQSLKLDKETLKSLAEEDGATCTEK